MGYDWWSVALKCSKFARIILNIVLSTTQAPSIGLIYNFNKVNDYNSNFQAGESYSESDLLTF